MESNHMDILEKEERAVDYVYPLVYTSRREVIPMKTAICKWGNSQGIRLPKSYLDALDISAGDVVDVTSVDNTIVIRKHEEKITFDSIFGEYTGPEAPGFDWGDPVGKEESVTSEFAVRAASYVSAIINEPE